MMNQINFTQHLKEKFENLKQYCSENKNKIIMGSCMVTVSAIAIYFGISYDKALKIIKEQNINIKNLNKVVNIQKDVIYDLRDKTSYLENLCSIKDQFYSTMSSDALRHGSSLGAQQMAYKRWHA